MDKKEKKRLYWIDIAKGIGVLLVVLGHESLPNYVQSWIYSFHMPLFFILSGYTFKCKNNYFQDVIIAFKRLMIPFVLYSFVFFTIDIVIFGLNSPIIQKDISSIMSGHGSFGVLWFLFSLFQIRIIYSAIERCLKGFFKCCVVCILVLTGYILNLIFDVYFFNLITSLVSLGFFYFGHMLNKYEFDVSNKKRINCIVYLATFFVASVISCYLNNLIFHQKIELSGAGFNSLTITYLGAISGSMLVIIISSYIERVNNIGSAVLTHLGFYSLWYYPLTAYIPNRFSKFVKDTSFDSFVFKLLSRVFAFVITYIIIAIYNKGIQKINNKKV